MTLALAAPAKLNLFLHVLGRRADGYHRLQTVFQLLDLCDRVRLRALRRPVIRRAGGWAGVPEADDLAVRAARLLQRETGVTQGAEITLEKRIPSGGGLGGGSSDAATVLLGLNQLWNLHWPPERLVGLGLQLGADVPVFVHGRSAWAEGVGERLRTLELPPAWYLVVTPPLQVSTAEVFQDPQLTRNTAPITISHFLSGGGRNDCQESVRRLYPMVAQALDWASDFGKARLTGTGASVFVKLPRPEAARAALQQLPSGWRGFLAQGVNDSPVWSGLNAHA